MNTNEGNILLDENYDITISEKQVNNSSQLLFSANKTFRYFAKELFNRTKVARLRISLLRGTPKWDESQEI
jgi:hypothetical protein